ncbi:TetR/AcrR family transcriptional regulator [Pseudomonas sp. v388]|uniref:TetR/AcrR family transcriptional regulator n=1 Tax=Pseudomonas sp. v388 TaxID=2479849 RepID=UPI0013150851|nr:TetR/AcrR family transcriptional regulator [Pseudomonas sp. v388]
MKTEFVPPTPKGRERVENLLSVATEVFLAQGYDGASLEDIISKSGGSRATVYRAFGGKQQLFEAVIESICNGYNRQLSSIDYAADSFEAGFRRLAVSLVDIAVDERQVAFYRLVLGNTARFPVVGTTWYSKGVGAVSAVFQNFLRSHITADQRDDEWIRSLADALQGTLVFCLLSNAATSLVTPPAGERSAAIETATRLATMAYEASAK